MASASPRMINAGSPGLLSFVRGRGRYREMRSRPVQESFSLAKAKSWRVSVVVSLRCSELWPNRCEISLNQGRPFGVDTVSLYYRRICVTEKGKIVTNGSRLEGGHPTSWQNPHCNRCPLRNARLPRTIKGGCQGPDSSKLAGYLERLDQSRIS